MIVCTGPSSVAQRVRGLRLGADAWITKPCHAEELICVIEAAVRRHRRTEMPALEAAASFGEITVRPDLYQAYVDEVSLELTAREFEILHLLTGLRSGAAPRGDLRAGVGLRDGPRRPLGRRVRAQAAPEAAGRLAGVELHPHPLRRRLPLRARARGRRPSEELGRSTAPTCRVDELDAELSIRLTGGRPPRRRAGGARHRGGVHSSFTSLVTSR